MKTEKKKYLPIDLQLFAEDPEDDDPGFEVDLSGFEIEGEDPENKEPDKKDPDKKDPDKKESVKDEEKENLQKALKQARGMIKALKAAGKSNEPEKDEDDTKTRLEDLAKVGFDEEQSKIFLELLKDASKKSGKSTDPVKDLEVRLEIKELKKDPLYKDLEDEDVSDIVTAYAKKRDMSVESAYLALYGKDKVKANRADLEREIEARIYADLKKKDGYGALNSGGGNGEVKLPKELSYTKDQLEIAKAAGMSIEEFLAYSGEVSDKKATKLLEKYVKKKG